MSSSRETRSSTDQHFYQDPIAEREFVQVFGYLRADITALRARCMKSAYCPDHNVWTDLHELEKTLSRAEEKMSDLSRRIPKTNGTSR
jgi:hypothetical protein